MNVSIHLLQQTIIQMDRLAVHSSSNRQVVHHLIISVLNAIGFSLGGLGLRLVTFMTIH